MKRRLLLVLAATSAWPAWGFAQEPAKPKSDPSTGRDSAVLEVVLKDLLVWPDSPLESGKATERQIFFSAEVPAYRLNVADVLDRNDKKEWDKLSPVQLGLARQAAEELVRRSRKRMPSRASGQKISGSSSGTRHAQTRSTTPHAPASGLKCSGSGRLRGIAGHQ